jgi:hypothetical protein
MTDKALAFVGPLLILYLTDSNSIYSSLESVLAISVILIPIIDLGVKDYVGYVYTKERDSCFERFDLLSLRLIVSSLAIAIAFYIVGNPFLMVAMALLRSAHINLYYYLQMKGRLTEKIVGPLRYSIIVTCTSALLTIFGFYAGLSDAHVLLVYFLTPSLLFLCYHVFQSQLFNPKLFSIDWNNPTYLVMIRFSVPIILNSFLVIGFSNLTKLYVLNQFGEEEMVRYSFDFRIAMVVQIIHMVIVTYLTKFLLISDDFTRIVKVYALYAILLVSIASLGLLVIFFWGRHIDPDRLVFDTLMCAIFGYTVFWCLSAFFDIFYTRLNKTVFILINSCAFFLSYILYYLFIGVESATESGLALFLSSLMMLLSNLMMIFINRNRLGA